MNPVLLFEDEASFGRISEPDYCWVFGSERPVVPAVRVREFRYVFGATDVSTGFQYWNVYEKCNTQNFNDYLAEISEFDSTNFYLMVVDGAGWHKAKDLQVPENIRLIGIPPYTPEMNPQEQVWREIRTKGFKNKLFGTIDEVVEAIGDTIRSIAQSTFKRITNNPFVRQMLKEK